MGSEHFSLWYKVNLGFTLFLFLNSSHFVKRGYKKCWNSHSEVIFNRMLKCFHFAKFFKCLKCVFRYCKLHVIAVRFYKVFFAFYVQHLQPNNTSNINSSWHSCRNSSLHKFSNSKQVVIRLPPCHRWGICLSYD